MHDVHNTSSNVTVQGSTLDDYIQNGGRWDDGSGDVWHDGGSKVTINARGGNDLIQNTAKGSNSSIRAAAQATTPLTTTPLPSRSAATRAKIISTTPPMPKIPPSAAAQMMILSRTKPNKLHSPAARAMTPSKTTA